MLAAARRDQVSAAASERDAAADALAEPAGQPLPGNLMMRREDVRALIEAGMDVGGHTRSHPILSGLTRARAEEEIAGGLDDIAAITGRRPTLFAYPNGRRGLDYGGSRGRHCPAAGRDGAFVTNRGIVTTRIRSAAGAAAVAVARGAGRFGLALWRAYSEPEWQPASEGAAAATGASLTRGRSGVGDQAGSLTPFASSQSSSAISTQTSSP